jgi:hypothetical protein
MEKKQFQKLLLNKTTVAALSREEMEGVSGGIVEETCDEPATAKSGAQETAEATFLSIVTCTYENGSHCRRCSSCCVGTKCSK